MSSPIAKLESIVPVTPAGIEILKPTGVIPPIPKGKFVHSTGSALPGKMMASKGPTSILLRTIRASMGIAKPAAPKATVTHEPSPSVPATPKESLEGPDEPTVLIPLPETPIELIKPKESLHRPREKQKRIPTADEALLKPDFLPAEQPKEAGMEGHQPLSLEGGWQPKETEPPAPKVRGEKQVPIAAGPIWGEIPPSWMGGPGNEVVQGFSKGEPVRTYKNKDGLEVTEFKQPYDPNEPWMATIELKVRKVDGVEKKMFGQIKSDPAKLEEEAAEALAPKE